jgi:hypothetical protein
VATRLLRQSEIEFARQVFEDSLPYGRVSIASYFLPWNDGVPVTLASASTFVPARSMRRYTIFFGREGFDCGADHARFADTFIHELTHVWQGCHGRFGWEYMVHSVIAQGRAIIEHGDRGSAYDYEPGKPWRDYNVEQQAMLVQDWFKRGMKIDDERYVYIAENLRAGHD